MWAVRVRWSHSVDSASMLVSVIVYNLTVGISKKEHTKDYVDAPHRAAVVSLSPECSVRRCRGRRHS